MDKNIDSEGAAEIFARWDVGSKKLSSWLTIWGLTPTQGAAVLRFSKSKVSEILSNKTMKPLPPYIEAHIDTFQNLPIDVGYKIISEALMPIRIAKEKKEKNK